MKKRLLYGHELFYQIKASNRFPIMLLLNYIEILDEFIPIKEK